MKHYVQYHNTEAMGYQCSSLTTFHILTNKPVTNVIGQTVWLIAGEGKPRTYTLCSVFVADEVGENPDGPFARYVRGKQGKLFRPPILLNTKVWFRPFLISQQNFSLGLREIASPFVDELQQLAKI